MKASIRAAVALLLGFGAQIAYSSEASLERCQFNADSLYKSGQISRLDRAKALRECNVSAYPGDPYRQEYWDYFVFIASEFVNGRISEERGKYLLSQKETELIERRNNQIRSALPPPPVQIITLPSCRNLPPGSRAFAYQQGQCQ